MTEYIGTETEKTFTIIDNNLKSSNPKDALGIKKVPFSNIPIPVIAEVGLGMLEGARKYGKFNWRTVGVRASVYYDACIRHLAQWYEGEDTDRDSGLSHVTKAICCLVVLRDSMLAGNLTDDRPPSYGYDPDDVEDSNWTVRLNKLTEEIIKKYPTVREANTQLDHRTTGNGIE